MWCSPPARVLTHARARVIGARLGMVLTHSGARSPPVWRVLPCSLLPALTLSRGCTAHGSPVGNSPRCVFMAAMAPACKAVTGGRVCCSRCARCGAVPAHGSPVAGRALPRCGVCSGSLSPGTHPQHFRRVLAPRGANSLRRLPRARLQRAGACSLPPVALSVFSLSTAG